PAIDPAKLTYTAPNEDGAAEAHSANEQQSSANPTQQKPEQGGQGSSFFR
ncbi:MAG: hypothetical protein RLY13_463, partial [Actinomycetota bacterium]